jgi:hypothetical protein
VFGGGHHSWDKAGLTAGAVIHPMLPEWPTLSIFWGSIAMLPWEPRLCFWHHLNKTNNPWIVWGVLYSFSEYCEHAIRILVSQNLTITF